MSDRIYYTREAEMRAARTRMTMVLIFMALGLGIGAVVALMFAPQEGAKTRRMISDTLGDTVETGREKVDQAMHNLEKEYPGVRRKFEKMVGDLV